MVKNQNKKYNIVNAVSLYSKGGLIVLLQFLHDLRKRGSQDYFIIYIQKGLNLPKSEHYKLIEINRLSKPRLLFWQGFQFYFRVSKDFPQIKKSNINYVLSLQNFNNYFPNVKKYIYFHQANIINDLKKFNMPWKTRLLINFVYKPLYWISVKSVNKIFVQAEWIKKKHIEYYGIAEHKIQIVSPYSYIDKKEIEEVVKKNCFSKINNQLDDRHYVHLFYPASNAVHKNQLVLINAIRKLIEKYPDKIKLYLTLSEKEIDSSWKLESLKDTVVLLGSLPRNTVLYYMDKMSALVFPSKIETIGLPLIEAAVLKKRIFAADRLYARELLKHYQNVSYMDINDSNSWNISLEAFIINGQQDIGPTDFNVSSRPTLLDLLDAE